MCVIPPFFNESGIDFMLLFLTQQLNTLTIWLGLEKEETTFIILLIDFYF